MKPGDIFNLLFAKLPNLKEATIVDHVDVPGLNMEPLYFGQNYAGPDKRANSLDRRDKADFTALKAARSMLESCGVHNTFLRALLS